MYFLKIRNFNAKAGLPKDRIFTLAARHWGTWQIRKEKGLSHFYIIIISSTWILL